MGMNKNIPVVEKVRLIFREGKGIANFDHGVPAMVDGGIRDGNNIARE